MALGHTILFESLGGGGYLEQDDGPVPQGIKKKQRIKEGTEGKGKESN